MMMASTAKHHWQFCLWRRNGTVLFDTARSGTSARSGSKVRGYFRVVTPTAIASSVCASSGSCVLAYAKLGSVSSSPVTLRARKRGRTMRRPPEHDLARDTPRRGENACPSLLRWATGLPRQLGVRPSGKYLIGTFLIAKAVAAVSVTKQRLGHPSAGGVDTEPQKRRIGWQRSIGPARASH